MNLGITVEIGPDNCKAVMEEAIRFITPYDVIVSYYKYLSNHPELLEIDRIEREKNNI
jgi:precorrin-3B methylase